MLGARNIECARRTPRQAWWVRNRSSRIARSLVGLWRARAAMSGGVVVVASSLMSLQMAMAQAPSSFRLPPAEPNATSALVPPALLPKVLAQPMPLPPATVPANPLGALPATVPASPSTTNLPVANVPVASATAAIGPIVRLPSPEQTAVVAAAISSNAPGMPAAQPVGAPGYLPIAASRSIAAAMPVPLHTATDPFRPVTFEEPIVVPAPDGPIGGITIAGTENVSSLFVVGPGAGLRKSVRDAQGVSSNVPPPDPLDLDSCLCSRQKQAALADLAGGKQVIVRIGPSIPTGGGFLRSLLYTGPQFTLSYRMHLGVPTERWMLFNEMGVGYSFNAGRDTRFSTPGVFTDNTILNTAAPNPPFNQNLNDFYRVRINQLQKFTVQGGFGFYYKPVMWDIPGERSVKFNARMGGRLGQADFRLDKDASPDLNALIAARQALRTPLSSTQSFRLTNVYGSDVFWGIYAGCGANITWYEADWFCFPMCQMALGIDLDYSHDFLRLNAAGPTATGLSTLTPMMTWNIMF